MPILRLDDTIKEFFDEFKYELKNHSSYTIHAFIENEEILDNALVELDNLIGNAHVIEALNKIFLKSEEYDLFHKLFIILCRPKYFYKINNFQSRDDIIKKFQLEVCDSFSDFISKAGLFEKSKLLQDIYLKQGKSLDGVQVKFISLLNDIISQSIFEEDGNENILDAEKLFKDVKLDSNIEGYDFYELGDTRHLEIASKSKNNDYIEVNIDIRELHDLLQPLKLSKKNVLIASLISEKYITYDLTITAKTVENALRAK